MGGGPGERENTEGIVLGLLSDFIPKGEWRREDCERAQRIGQRQRGGRPRPILAILSRPGEVDKILDYKRGRAEMKGQGIFLGNDLTRTQQDRIREEKERGREVFYSR